MDIRLTQLLDDFAARGTRMFAPNAQDNASHKPNRRTPRQRGKLFSKFLLAVALRSLNFPDNTRAEEQSHTEDFDDRGLDGIAISHGSEYFTSIEGINQAIQLNPDGITRILFIQAKYLDDEKNQHLAADDVRVFGPNVRSFLSKSPADYEAVKTNNAVARQHKIFHALKDALESKGKWNPVIHIVFGIAKEYKFYAGTEDAHSDNESIVGDAIKTARVQSTIWSDLNIIELAHAAGLRTSTTLKNVKLIPVPTGKSKASRAFIGIIPAASITEALTITVNGEVQLNECFFTDNPRAEIGDDQEASPGGYGIRRAIRDGNGDAIALGHNGLVITATHSSEPKDEKITLEGAQIVNGCQSCHAFFAVRNKLAGVLVPLKIVVSNDVGLRDDIIIASNSQAPIDGFDILACRDEMRRLQLEFHQETWDSPQRLWLRRRRNEELDYPNGVEDEDKTLSPKDLVNAFAAAVWGHPHTIHSDGKWPLNKTRKGELLSADHDPMLYKALGWIIAKGRTWGRRQSKPFNWHIERGDGAFGARHQFIYALWRLSVDNPDSASEGLLKEGAGARDRFQNAVNRLSGPNGDRLADLAAEAVRAGAPNEPRSLAFTQAVKTKADSLRSTLS